MDTQAMRKLKLEIGGKEVDQNSPAHFERQVTASGTNRLRLSVPIDQDDLFQKLAARLPEPYYALYILHTPRGEGETGRYQSQELSWSELDAFLRRYRSYLAGDARFDFWVYSISAKQTLVWNRHNQIIIENEPLDQFVDVLTTIGFREEPIGPLGDHIHYYRSEFDEDAQGVLASFGWYRTPLRDVDEQ